MEENLSPSPPARSSSVKGLVIFALVCFVIGVAAMGWLVAEWTPARNLLFGAPQAHPSRSAPLPPRALEAPAPPQADAEASPEAHMAKIEEKLAQIDQQADSASNDAARAERMMIAFAARRAIERGAALGYLEGALMRQFGGSDANAVSVVIKGARAPVTLDQLEESLDAARPALSSGGLNAGWLSRIWEDLGNVAVIRKAGEKRFTPDQRFERARRALERDRVELAIREVEAMPGKDAARDWLVRAQRYVQVRKALDRLEAITLAPTA
ncbi:hypothetical protein D5I55_12370 [Chakrabartia godavariana]|nr:hypothetical protein D5I55_12370 [Chakrabartia godavariana]